MIVPMYDWSCSHGHEFEHNVLIADRLNPIPCQGKVAQLCEPTDEGAHEIEAGINDNMTGEPTGKSVMVWVRDVPCMLQAERVEISHAHPSSMLDYGLGRNRDLAREGRYTGEPSTRGVRKVPFYGAPKPVPY